MFFIVTALFLLLLCLCKRLSRTAFAVVDGASSVMVTGETAVGRYPAETIRYLVKTAEAAEQWLRSREKADED